MEITIILQSTIPQAKMSDANGSDVSLDELQQRLVTFTEQLQTIHEILQTDPENAEYLNIASDLVEVIKLTKEMIDIRLGSTASTATTARRSAPSEASAPSATAPQETEPAIEFTPGTICEAQSKGVWFPAFIESLTARDTYNVHYLGFGNKEELPPASLREVTAAAAVGELPPREAIAVGFKCWAKYYVDAQFYMATVTAVTTYGYQVLFDGYGNSEEVPYEYMRPVAATTEPQQTTDGAAGISTGTATTSAVPVVKPREAVVTKAIKVPEHLVVLPTDTEAEKERKRKRLKTIQKLNKQIEVDNAHNAKQHDWKSFQQKAIKKNVRGSGVLSKRGTSMFASPDSVQGRVGVVGSGQGMTQYDDTRKKLKKSTLESAPRL